MLKRPFFTIPVVICVSCVILLLTYDLIQPGRRSPLGKAVVAVRVAIVDDEQNERDTL